MIRYHINEMGDIIGSSTFGGRPMSLGVFSVVLESPLSSPRDYFWNGEGIVERQGIDYSIPKNKIEVDEQLVIVIPYGVKVYIDGPGVNIEGVSDGSVRFFSERAGVYNFTLENYPNKIDRFKVEVF